MFKPKKYVRLEALYAMPSVSDCKRLLAEGNKSRGSTVELPWRSQKSYAGYSLTVRIELGGAEPIWTLYEGEGNRARVIWSSPFEDIELMHDVLHLSLPAEDQPPSLFAPQPAPEPVLQPRQEPIVAAGEFANGPRMEKMANFPKPDGGSDFFSGPSEPPQLLTQPTLTPVVKSNHEPTRQPPAPPPAPAQPPAAAPAAPPPAPYPYPAQPGYGYPPGYPPGYPYPQAPQGYAYPPGYPAPGYQMDPRYYQQQTVPPGYPAAPNVDPTQYVAQTVPVQPGAAPPPLVPPHEIPPAVAKPDPELLRKRPNVMLGSFLTEAGLIPDSTLQAALRLQDMVKAGTLKTSQAAEAVRRAHERGGNIDQAYFTASTNVDKDVRIGAPPLGQILVEAGLINPGTLKAALSLQDVVRTGAMTKEDAIAGFIREHYGADDKPEAKKERDADQAVDLLKQAGLLNEKDLEAARAVRKRHGGNISKILLAAGKLDGKTFEAALKCKELMRGDKMKMEQSMILLNYCQRSRMSFDEAVEELGWELNERV